MKPLVLTPLQGLPMVQPGDDLAALLLAALLRQGLVLQDGDVIVLAQKIVSKAEVRYRQLGEVTPTERALELGTLTEKDPRLVQLILDESNEVLRARPGLLIVEHRLGFVSANAGIDHSNLPGSDEDTYLLLPEDPDASASRLRGVLEQASAAKLGVLIIDSHGRAWREGTLGTTIGLSGMPGLVDLRGTPDLAGRPLRVTQLAAGDELAAAASLAMGQAAEGCPAVHVRGFPYALREATLSELLRSRERDEFR
ncbi:MAG TPA: coenzyme F420-0:L-glutamate ligase [Anaerolineales bacterium]|nr:coenzyme F420-0:L-glutamate ligase [Anaerolineales bacterium]HRQ91477.1 coenzyme F420-0:L-glutamate ligase [Anaerolineales bacterium]